MATLSAIAADVLWCRAIVLDSTAMAKKTTKLLLGFILFDLSEFLLFNVNNGFLIYLYIVKGKKSFQMLLFFDRIFYHSCRQ